MQADRDYHANRSRGLGGNPTTGAEENLLGYPGTRYWGEHIFVHEFAHAIMGGGIRDVDPAMFAEIRAAYDAAMAAGKYVHPDGRKHYATTNAGEYWAEGVQWWFFSNYGECFAGSVKVETPEEFAAYDPDAERADRPRLHDAPHPDGRLPREAHPSGHLRLIPTRRRTIIAMRFGQAGCHRPRGKREGRRSRAAARPAPPSAPGPRRTAAS